MNRGVPPGGIEYKLQLEKNPQSLLPSVARAKNIVSPLELNKAGNSGSGEKVTGTVDSLPAGSNKISRFSLVPAAAIIMALTIRELVVTIGVGGVGRTVTGAFDDMAAIVTVRTATPLLRPRTVAVSAPVEMTLAMLESEDTHDAVDAGTTEPVNVTLAVTTAVLPLSTDMAGICTPVTLLTTGV